MEQIQTNRQMLLFRLSPIPTWCKSMETITVVSPTKGLPAMRRRRRSAKDNSQRENGGPKRQNSCCWMDLLCVGRTHKIGKDRRKVSLHTASHPHSSTSCVVLALDGLFRGDIPHCRLYCLLPTSCKIITVENSCREWSLATVPDCSSPRSK